jgi:hypothetical protein
MKSRPVAGIFLAFLFVSLAFSQSKSTRALSGTDQYQGLTRIDRRLNDRNQATPRHNATQHHKAKLNVGASSGVSRGYVNDSFDATVLGNWTHWLQVKGTTP